MKARTSLQLLFVTVLLCFATVAHATGEGTAGGGGGSSYEPEFKEVAKNIADWIKSGNADHLKLPTGLSRIEFKTKMLSAFANTTIEIGSTPIRVGGISKTCAGTVLSPNKNVIRCFKPEFASLYRDSADQTYRLIFHEYAGLAGVEKNQGGRSDYSVSDQISKHLQDEVVRRLPVVKTDFDGVTSSHLLSCGDDHLVLLQNGQFGYDIKKNENFVLESIDVAGFFRWVRSRKNSTLAKAETDVVRCAKADGSCDRGEIYLAQQAPSNGMQISGSDDDELQMSDDVTRYTEMYEMSIHTHGYDSAALEIDVETYASPDWEHSTNQNTGLASRAVSEVFIKAIRTVSVDGNGNEVRKTLYRSNSKALGPYTNCKPAIIPAVQAGS